MYIKKDVCQLEKRLIDKYVDNWKVGWSGGWLEHWLEHFTQLDSPDSSVFIETPSAALFLSTCV